MLMFQLTIVLVQFLMLYSGSSGQFTYSTPQLTLDEIAGGLLGNFTNGPIGGASDPDLLQLQI